MNKEMAREQFSLSISSQFHPRVMNDLSDVILESLSVIKIVE